MPIYTTPGTYYEAVDLDSSEVNPLRTDIAAFVGIAERGPLHTPLPITTWEQYQSTFGNFISQGYLAYSVKAFFENNGSRCHIVRVAADTASVAAGVLLDAVGSPTIAISANSPGIWGNQLSVEASHASSTATSTRNAIQPASRLASLVSTVSGFSVGTLVKAFQSVLLTEYHVVTAVEPGLRQISWDSPLGAGFDLTKPISFESVEFALAVRQGGKLMELFTGLSVVASSPKYVETVINGVSQQIQVQDLKSAAPAPQNLPDLLAPNLTNGLLMLGGGLDGLAALQIEDFTGLASDLSKRGIRTLEDVDEISIVAIPDILIQPTPPVLFTPPITPVPDPCALCPGPPAPAAPLPSPVVEIPPTFSLDEIYYVQQALVDHCEAMRYRIAVLDPPLFSVPGESRELQEIQSWRQRFDSSYAALYFPWVLVYDPLQLGGNPVRAIPPSGHVAGTYANYDLTVGVHRAPANFALNWIQALMMDISAVEQGLLNPAGINCLRVFPARGLRVYGARTLSSNSSWTYVNVRRLMMMIEKATEYALQWAVFEPNNAQLRLRVSSALTVFLESIYEAGALSGASDKEAFFVKCDATNNTPDLLDVGQFLAEVGVAPAIPAEFIVFRVGRTADRLEVTE